MNPTCHYQMRKLIDGCSNIIRAKDGSIAMATVTGGEREVEAESEYEIGTVTSTDRGEGVVTTNDSKYFSQFNDCVIFLFSSLSSIFILLHSPTAPAIIDIDDAHTQDRNPNDALPLTRRNCSKLHVATPSRC